MRDLDNHFGEYVHLRHLPREDEALHTLRRAASCVKPIMRKRGWRVGSLCEFYPDEANLLGLNVGNGMRINIRLRYPGDVRQFMPFDQVLDTLLHELVHNVQGEHNERFYKIWDELRDEWFSLQLKGYTGEGFLGKGQVLGGRRVPVDEARRLARAAALDRQKQKGKPDSGRKLGGAPPGAGITGPHMRDVIANAIQRRNKIEKTTGGCGVGNKAAERAAEDALKNGFRTKAEMDDANDAAIAQALIELMEQEEERILQGLPPHPSSPTMPDMSGGLEWSPEHGLQPARTSPPPANLRTAPPSIPTQSKPVSKPATSAPRPAPASRPPPPRQPELNPHGRPISRLIKEAEAKKNKTSSNKLTKSPSGSSTDLPSTSNSSSGTWECNVCTLLNSASNTHCEACESPRPRPSGSKIANGYVSGRPQTPSSTSMTSHAPIGGPLGWNCQQCGTFMENRWWTCSYCGMMKATS